MEDLAKKIKKFGKVSLFSTFKEKGSVSKEYIVTLFLAILELTNNKGIRLYQDNKYGDIIITQERK